MSDSASAVVHVLGVGGDRLPLGRVVVHCPCCPKIFVVVVPPKRARTGKRGRKKRRPKSRQSKRPAERSAPVSGGRRSYRQRALWFGVPYESGITIRALLAKEGSECRLCGSPVLVGVRWPEYDPEMASIDHIVPMSKGGGHVWDNVQIAHHCCNALKGTAGPWVEKSD